MIKNQLLICFLFINSLANAQGDNLGGYKIVDSLVYAVHPRCGPQGYVTGMPDDSIWVNLSYSMANDSMTGTFASGHADIPGPDLMIETGYHYSSYEVTLIMKDGSLSIICKGNQKWISLPALNWKFIESDCTAGSYYSGRFIYLLDFSADFGLSQTDTVCGIKIKFLLNSAGGDLAGVYIVDSNYCPVLDLGKDTMLCTGQTLILNGSDNFSSWKWQDNSNNKNYEVISPGTYRVTASTLRCSRTDEINVTFSNLIPYLGPDRVLCEGDSLILDSKSAGATIRWQDNSTDTTYIVKKPGIYWVELQDNYCTVRDSVIIRHGPYPVTDLGEDQVLCDGESLMLSAFYPQAKYTWQDGSHRSVFLVAEPGTYWVQTNLDGCRSYDTVSISYNNCEVHLKMPNVFTPDKNGINDHFVPQKFLGIENATLYIYNRWGQNIFETTDLLQGWNGDANGTNCEEGSYYWIIKYSTIRSQTFILSGSVMLIR